MQDWPPQEIEVFRKSFRLSRRALGDLLGVSGNYIYLLEKGVKTPSKTIRILLDYVQKDLEERRKEDKQK